MDVVGAFLHADIDEEVYLEPPDGMDIKNGFVLKVQKSLYDLKKSPKYWYEKLNSFILEEGFTRSQNDLCLFYKDNVYSLIYVDDILIFSPNQKHIDDLKLKFNKSFKMKDIGLVSKFLGMKITQTDENIAINQTDYIESLLKKFNVETCKSVPTPMDPKFTYSGELDPKYEHQCRSLVGALLYVSLCSRPDVTTAVSILTRYQHIANETLWIALKRILRYLRGTINLSLFFPGYQEHDGVQAFADADWAGDAVTRKSTSGYIIQLFGYTVLWQTRRQNSVSLSTAEAEYISLSEACSDVMWTLYILKDLGVPVQKPVTINEDNQGAIRMAADQTKRSKHIDVRYHFIRDKMEEKFIDLKYIDSSLVVHYLK